MLVLVVCLCPSSVHVVATFPGIVFLILSREYCLVSVKLVNNYGWALDIKLREMGEEVSYVTVANQTTVSIGAFMYALIQPGGLHYAAVRVSVPQSYTIRKLSHFTFNNL